MYEFESKYGKLPVYNQGQAEECWDYAWANHLNAWRRIYDGISPHYSADEAMNWSAISGQPGYIFHTPDGDMQATNVNSVPCAGLSSQVLKNALLHNGIASLSVPSRAKQFDKYQDQRTLPIIHMGAREHPNQDHATLAVGFTADGLIMLNSWGRDYGCRGRVVLGWDFLRRGCSIAVEQYGDHPLNGLS